MQNEKVKQEATIQINNSINTMEDYRGWNQMRTTANHSQFKVSTNNSMCGSPVTHMQTFNLTNTYVNPNYQIHNMKVGEVPLSGIMSPTDINNN